MNYLIPLMILAFAGCAKSVPQSAIVTRKGTPTPPGKNRISEKNFKNKSGECDVKLAVSEHGKVMPATTAYGELKFVDGSVRAGPQTSDEGTTAALVESSWLTASGAQLVLLRQISVAESACSATTDFELVLTSRELAAAQIPKGGCDVLALLDKQVAPQKRSYGFTKAFSFKVNGRTYVSAFGRDELSATESQLLTLNVDETKCTIDSSSTQTLDSIL